MKRAALILAAVLAACAAPAGAQEATIAPPQEQPTGLQTVGDRLNFVAISVRARGGYVQLANGQVVDSADWAAVAPADADGQAICTLTLIGPQLVLLAAHCLDLGQRDATGAPVLRQIGVRFDDGAHASTACGVPGVYFATPARPADQPQSSYDFAVCRLKTPVNGVYAEDLRPDTPMPAGTAIRLMGFGCDKVTLDQNDHMTFSRSDGRLRTGQESIEASGASMYNGAGIYLRTLSQTNREPVLCPGDSGGPAFFDAGTGRSVVAVNSAVMPTPTASHYNIAFYSYLSPLSDPAFLAWLMKWACDHPGSDGAALVVCGVNRPRGMAGCRA